MKKSISIILALIMIFSLAACGKGPEIESTTENTTESTENTESTGILSSFSSVDLEGNAVDQSIFKGKKVTMVNIWATFCGPCIREMPDLQKLSENYADKDFQIVGIVCDVMMTGEGQYDATLLNNAKDIVETTGVKYISLLPSDSLKKAKLDSVYSVPETIFVDENGNQIGSSYIGSKSYEDWAKIIDDVLESVK